MDLDTPHISANGEMISKRELIAEIEGLLNTIGRDTQRNNTKDNANANPSTPSTPSTPSMLAQTTLSVEIMATLAFEELVALRDNLLQKDSLQENKQWLLGLTKTP